MIFILFIIYYYYIIYFDDYYLLLFDVIIKIITWHVNNNQLSFTNVKLNQIKTSFFLVKY